MKKVLVVLNGIYTSAYALAAAVNLAKETNSFLHALFLNADRKGTEGGYFFPNDLALTENVLTGQSIQEENNQLVAAHIKSFEKMCEQANISYEIDARSDYQFNELIELSQYYDIIFADAEADFFEYPLFDILVDAHCPVILTTTEFNSIQNIVLAYDGSPSSVQAIKMFTYLFPEWLNKKVHLVSVDTHEKSSVDNTHIKAFLSARCNDLTPVVLQGKPDRKLVDFLKTQSKNTLVVMGAYGKSAVSRLFHKSLSDIILDETTASVFSTHS